MNRFSFTGILRHGATCVIIAATASLSFSGCHSIEKWESSPRGNFEALWTAIDEHYCFFDEKDIDWDAVHTEYSARISDEMEAVEFFNICAEMLSTLRDGHVNLSSSFNTSYYRKWWSDYPQNYNERLIEQYYLNFDYATSGGVSYKELPGRNVGYMRYSSFSGGIGETLLDMMLYGFKETDGLIIDIRDNGGGNMTNVEKLASRFLPERTLAGYICHKKGPGHNDFSEPYPYYFDPSERVRWFKPVIVLTNRSTFSAANNFVSVMQYLPHVLIVGAQTGGGSGMPYSSELPCGWAVRMSACPVYDCKMQATEDGIAPQAGCTVGLDPEDEARGIDTMLEFAITLLNRFAQENKTDGASAAKARSVGQLSDIGDASAPAQLKAMSF